MILATAAILGLSAGIVGWSAPDRMSYRSGDFYSHDSESFRTENALESERPGGALGSPSLAVITRGSPETAGVRIERKLEGSPLIAQVEEYILSSRNGKSSYVLAWLAQSDQERQGTPAARIAKELAAPGVEVGGHPLAAHEFAEQIGRDLRRMEVIAVPLLTVLALWVFRSFVAALLPVSLGGFAFLIVLGLLRVITELIPLSVFALDIALALTLGLGVDYSLLMLSRFREGLSAGHSPEESATEALRTVGRTVAFSSVAISVSCSALLVVPIPFIRSFAVGGGLAAIVTGLSALVLLPALLVLLGRRVNAVMLPSWRGSLEHSSQRRDGGIWYRIARLDTEHAVLVALLSTAALVVLALPLLSIRSTGVDATLLPTSSDARQFAEKARHEFAHSLVGEVVVAGHTDARREPGVSTRVNELAEHTGLGTPLPVVFKHSPQLWEMRLNPTGPVFSHRAERLVSRLRELNAPISVGGETADFMDSVSTLDQKAPLVVAIVALSSFILVFLATGSLLLPIKTLAMNILSLAAALGLVVFIFQGGRFEGFLDYTSQGAIIVTLPLVMAAAAFGLLTDYGLFLLMGIKEERERGHPDRRAIALGLERTGRIITAAAILFAAAVGPFLASGLLILKVAATALVSAIVLDAFVVRPLLAPSLMAILGKWNWWPRRMPDKTRDFPL
jgi:uncharacterized membrane protein YdfJ with MMPL/SSD domain